MCEDVPELKIAMENRVLNEYDTKRYCYAVAHFFPLLNFMDIFAGKVYSSLKYLEKTRSCFIICGVHKSLHNYYIICLLIKMIS